MAVNIWEKYLKYYTKEHSTGDPAADEKTIRAECERALSACGLHYDSDSLWKLYIDWELKVEDNRKRNLKNSQQKYREDFRKIFRICDRLLKVATKKHDQHWAK